MAMTVVPALTALVAAAAELQVLAVTDPLAWAATAALALDTPSLDPLKCLQSVAVDVAT